MAHSTGRGLAMLKASQLFSPANSLSPLPNHPMKFFLSIATLPVLAGALLSACSHKAPDTGKDQATAASTPDQATRTTGTRADSINGIPGHHFGESLSNFPGLQLTGVQEGSYRNYYYAKEGRETGWFGKHKKDVSATFYMFQDGKFAAFQAVAYGPGCSVLSDETVFLFGRGENVISSIAWEGKQVRVRYTDRFLNSQKAQVLDVVSLPLLAEQEQAKAARLKAENAVQ